jgi:hypothetical protein
MKIEFWGKRENSGWEGILNIADTLRATPKVTIAPRKSRQEMSWLFP